MNSSVREARMILPTHDNHGRDLSTVLASLQQQLVAAFGGVTIMSGVGTWMTPLGASQTEGIINFVVAAENSLENCATLRNIALHHGRMARQKSIYIKDFGGAVSFLEPQIEEETQAA